MPEPNSFHEDSGWRGGAGRERRLPQAIALALLVHAALLIAPGLREADPQALAPPLLDAVEVEIVALADQPGPLPPVAVKEPPKPPTELPKQKAAALDERPFIPSPQPSPSNEISPSAAPSASALHSGSEVSSPDTVTGAPDAPQASGPAREGNGSGDGRKGLSPSQLGLGGGVMRTAMADMLEKAPKPEDSTDAAQLRQELLDEDTRTGLGAGWELAALVRRVATDRAPLGSTATFAFEVAASGAVTGIVLQTATSARGEWIRLLDRLRLMIVQLQRAPAAPLTAVLELRNRSTRRAGDSERLTDFDVANIGSPWIQQLNVRVLRQAYR